MTEQEFTQLAVQGANRIPLCLETSPIWTRRCPSTSNWPTSPSYHGIGAGLAAIPSSACLQKRAFSRHHLQRIRTEN
jgi:hypothetical protein